MYETAHKFRDTLRSGRVCLGPSITLSDIAVTEALGPTVDFVWIDLEHNPTGLESMFGHLIAARATDTMAIVRVPSSEKSIVKRVLDVGAPGIIVPQVTSAEEVRNFVRECRYAPQGLRGYGPRRSTNYGRNTGGDYLKAANRGVFTIAQIERVAAVRELDEILAIDELDSIVLGPNDLAHDMGYPGNEFNDETRKTMEEITAKALKAGKFVGAGSDHVEWAPGAGIQWIQPGGDVSYMVSKCEEYYASLRGALGVK